MEFCQNCGTRMILRAQSIPVHRCLKCGYKIQSSSNEARELNYRELDHPTIAILDKQKLKLKTFPTLEATCPACGNNRAETWTVPIGSEGTSSVTFFRCTSCGHTRREKE